MSHRADESTTATAFKRAAPLQWRKNYSSDVCDSCSKTWDQFANGRQPSNQFAPLTSITGDVQQLRRSSCRICTLYADALVTHGSVSNNLKLWWRFPHRIRRSQIELKFDSMWSPSRHDPFREPHLVVSRSKTYSELQSLYPEMPDFHIIRSWIRTCELTHAGRTLCSIGSTDDLKSLKVIDCEQLVVIPAPPGCKYTALSYVWGSPSGTVTSANFRLSDDAPATIKDSIQVTLVLGYKYL
jgi:hypothetical protein